MQALLIIGMVVVVILTIIALCDICQRKHAIIGHLRYLLEAIGPELRQYIVTDNDSERPFSRDQRHWIYASSKKENSYFGFGTDNSLDVCSHYYVIKHHAFPHPLPAPNDPDYDKTHPLSCAKVLGASRRRSKAFPPESAICAFAMSYGSLGKAAVEAINKGCGITSCGVRGKASTLRC